GQVGHGDLLTVDNGRDARILLPLGRVAVDVFHARFSLELLEDVAGYLAQLAIAAGLGEHLANLLHWHLARRNMRLALENDELLIDSDDVRDFAWPQAERDPLEIRIAHVLANRLDQAFGTGAIRVYGAFFGQIAE